MFFISLIAQAVDVILRLIIFMLIAQVIASWLIAFGVLNTRNRAVYMIVDVLDRSTAPLLRPIRRVIPSLGGLDISPLILYLLIDYVIRPILFRYAILPYLLTSG
jgi:YggT family protein